MGLLRALAPENGTQSLGEFTWLNEKLGRDVLEKLISRRKISNSCNRLRTAFLGNWSMRKTSFQPP